MNGIILAAKLPEIIARRGTSGKSKIETALKVREIVLPHLQCGINFDAYQTFHAWLLSFGSFAAMAHSPAVILDHFLACDQG